MYTQDRMGTNPSNQLTEMGVKHMRNTVWVSLSLVCLLSLAVPSLAQTSTRIRLAVMDFSAPSGASDRGYADSSRKGWGDPGRMMSELLTTHFAKSGRFDVVERARLYQVLNEKQIQAGTGILGEQARTIGQQLALSAIVTGGYAPNAYGYEVSARVVSVADGSILATENVLVPTDSAWMDQSMAILAGKLSAPWSKERGYVLDVFLESDKLPLLMIDLGTAQGASLGRQVEVSTAGDPIIHPVTKEILGTRDVPLATAQIIKADKEYSYARVMDRTGVISTPVKADRDGIDLGIERLQRVKLTDARSDVIGDADMSVLSVVKPVQINSDIPDAKLLVDGRPTPLNGGSTSVRMAAGTHLVELQVGQLLLSREVTVTRAGPRPKDIAFRQASLISAVAVKPPDTSQPVAGATIVARTVPELTAQDQKADEKLLSMLPKPQVIDEQLRAARDQSVTSVFEAGLKALRFGYAKGNRSYLSIAATRFSDVVRLAPEVALGHFNLGLAKFYLDNIEEARIAFDQAVKLDKSLEEDVPLLWWEDFSTLPGTNYIQPMGSSPAWGVTDGLLWYKGQDKDGLVLKCWHPGKQWSEQNTAVEVRFRMVSQKPGLLLVSRFRGDSWISAGLGPEAAYIGQAGPSRSIAAKPIQLAQGWHTARFETVGETARLYLDGELLLDGHQVPLWQGLCDVGIGNCTAGEMLVDWVLVTRL